jgi:hypothetical protein
MAAVLAGLFAAIGLAAFGTTIGMTVRSYPRLPDRVPYHFDFVGRPDQYGPRPMVFITPAAFGLAFGIWLFATIQGGIDSVAPIFIGGGVTDFVLIAGFFLQRGILNVAEGKTEQMHPYAFWKN